MSNWWCLLFGHDWSEAGTLPVVCMRCQEIHPSKLNKMASDKKIPGAF